MSQELVEKLNQLQASAQSLSAQASSLDELQNLKVVFLGKKGHVTDILKSLAQLSAEEKKTIGQEANLIKNKISQILDEREIVLKKQAVEAQLSAEKIDVTLDGLKMPLGKLHPVTLIMEEMKDIFRKFGFDIAEGPEIETDHYNFAALNIPEHHPARDMQDTFYFPDGKLLRTHTSPVQIHFMENNRPPIAMVAPGVVYRCDSDVTHSPMFHQLEALYVDRHVTFGHLKAVIKEFLQLLFGTKLETKFRASFFPFTEPSAEVDMSCVFCSGKGCRVCKYTGWIEILGCGMVDPAVFAQVGVDSQIYSGFAFGVGIERVAMLKYGIQDIRLLFENDIRFLQQF